MGSILDAGHWFMYWEVGLMAVAFFVAGLAAMVFWDMYLGAIQLNINSNRPLTGAVVVAQRDSDPKTKRRRLRIRIQFERD